MRIVFLGFLSLLAILSTTNSSGLCTDDEQISLLYPVLIKSGIQTFVEACNCNCTGNGNTFAVYDFTNKKVLLSFEDIRSYRILPPEKNCFAAIEVSYQPEDEDNSGKNIISDTFVHNGNVYQKKTDHCSSIIISTSSENGLNRHYKDRIVEMQNQRELTPAVHDAAMQLYKKNYAGGAADLMATYISATEINNLISHDISFVNDYGFFLTESKRYDSAISILHAVLLAYPDRIPAYLNIADAYTGVNDTEKAKKYYQTYIDKMTSIGKAGKIPKRVLQAVK